VKRKIAGFLEGRNRFTILSHVDPDGDAVGSALGLAWILRGMGKEARVLVPERIPRIYEFLPGAADVEGIWTPRERPDGVFVVDATSPDRLADLEAALLPGVPIANVDHHPDNTRFGELDWVDPTAAATALMIFEMACETRLPVDRRAAECLYTGILTDTGRFTFSNTDARSLRAAAELAALGCVPSDIAAEIYARVSPASMRLLACALSTLDVREEGAVACLHVTMAMLMETGALPEDADGFSTYARSLEGVKVGIFLRETAEGTIKVSFRSNEGVAIDAVAGRFGGGGHPRASGARVPGPIEEAKEEVLQAVAEHLRSTLV
jgi:phosphoesterase RecJ-like protein